MATKKQARPDQRSSVRSQQGAKGRLHTDPSVGPILAPRGSKVPAQDSDYLTTQQGVRLPNTDDSLKAGVRGPTVLDDFHLREKVMHFDHERIPERVVHARGAAAHGVFEANGAAEALCAAGFLRKGVRTPVSTITKLIDHMKSLEGPSLQQAVETLRELVDAHVADEEDRLLPKLAKAASAEQLDWLGAHLEQTKQRVG